MELPIAESILAIVSFIAGTLAPAIYSRISFDGIAIKQPSDLRVLMSNQKSDMIHVGTILKIANVRKDAILLDDVSVNRIVVGSTRYNPARARVTSIMEDYVEFPLDKSGFLKINTPPLIVQSETHCIVALEVAFEPSRLKGDAISRLADHIEKIGLDISFRINGKLRSYRVVVRGEKRVEHDPDQFVRISLK